MVMAGAVLSAWAHGGEDHDHGAPAPAPAPVQVGQAPRAAAQTEEFEMVAVLQGTPPVLTLYVDRFASNAPVEGATVELESGAFKAVAKVVAPGVYTVPGQAFSQPGRYPLTVSVQTTDGADLLDAILQYEAPVAKAAAPAASGRGLWAWGGGVVALLVAAGLVLRRRAHKTEG